MREAGERSITPPRAEAFDNTPGRAAASVEGHRLAVGNARLMEREGVGLGGLEGEAARMAGEGRTVVVVAIDGRVAGLLAIADAVRDTAGDAIAALRGLGVEPVSPRRPGHGRARRSRGGHRGGARPGAAGCRRWASRWPGSSPRAAASPWSETASTMPRLSRGRTWASRSARNRRGGRDSRHRPDALGSPRRRDGDSDQPWHGQEDAPEPRLGHRLQLPRPPDRGGGVRAVGS